MFFLPVCGGSGGPPFVLFIINGGGGAAAAAAAGSSDTRISCQKDELNADKFCEIVSSLRQHSTNSSSVTTPSWFISIFLE